MIKSIAQLCREHALEFDELVARCGLETSRVQAIFLGRWTPSPAERQAIARVFDLEVGMIRWGHRTPIQHIYGMGPQ